MLLIFYVYSIIVRQTACGAPTYGYGSTTSVIAPTFFVSVQLRYLCTIYLAYSVRAKAM